MSDELESGSIGYEPISKPLDKEALRSLAIAIIEGRVFGTWNVPDRDSELLPSIFMPLLLMDELMIKQMVIDGYNHMYEFTNKAGPMAINGYPIFYSGYPIRQDDFEKVRVLVERMRSALDEIE